MRKFILASSSPRRKEILKQLGLTFSVYPSNIDERLTPGLSPRKQVEVLSMQKAQAVSPRFSDAVILSADTMVSLGRELIGKPRNAKDAIVMLKKLSMTQHAIVTAFTLLDTKTEKIVTKSTVTKIWFRKMTKEEITAFVKREKPFDKAGAYAVHELAAIFVQKIEGDYMGAIGLSVFSLAKELKKFGIDVL